MDALRRSLWDAETYPENLVSSQTYSHRLQSFAEALRREEENLFYDESSSEVYFWETQWDTGQFPNEPGCARSALDLRKRLAVTGSLQKDPMCRLIFTRAKDHSRDKLQITREMLSLILSYHQVMPEILDLLFPFGSQEQRKEFHFITFRYAGHEHSPNSDLAIPQLGRSGRFLQLCYNLESVENGKYPKEWPWSIRQTAVYHSFDLETGRAVWIMVKGNSLIKRRVIDATKGQIQSAESSFSHSLSAALEVHLMLCDWAAENWRWYIDFLDKQIRASTQDTLTYSPRLGMKTKTNASWQQRPRTAPEAPRRTGTFDHLAHSIRRVLTDKFKRSDSISQPYGLQDIAPLTRTDPQIPRFQFESFRDLQHLQEKILEVLLVFEMNIKVLLGLKQYYLDTFEAENFPEHMGKDCIRSIHRFDERIKGIISGLKMQQVRMEGMLGLLKDRKNLFHEILNYENMEVNRTLAEKTQLSADRMEKMTEHMRLIAMKTEQETVSMRIVTIVTLFFLPGTFISTFMSTDIIRYHDGRKSFSLNALRMYFIITIPLMSLTFFFAYLYYIYIRGKGQRRWNDLDSLERGEGTESNSVELL